MTSELPAQSKNSGAVAGTASFSKFMRVLDAIAAGTGQGVNINELNKSTGYPKPTLYRIVDALLAQGLVVPSGAQSFGLGPRLIALASRALESSDIRQVCGDELLALRELTQETIHLAVPVNGAMTYIDKLESPKAVRMNSRLGSQVTLYSSSVGKAYLAALDESHRNRLINAIEFRKFTDATLLSAPALRGEIAQIQKRGYAQDREENERAIACYGCAILDKNGKPIACMSISIPLFRISADRQGSYIDPLKKACKAITQKLRALDLEA